MSESVSHPLSRLFAPRSVAVVGASPKGGYGLNVVKNLEVFGYTGAIYPVNPNYEEIGGYRAYGSLRDIPEPVDAVAIAVPARATPGVVRDAVAAGVGGGVVFAAGFAELDDDGRQLQEELRALCAEASFPLVGPNCLGIVNYHAHAPLWGITTGSRTEPGHVALVAQSGNLALSFMVTGRSPRLAYATSCGNQAVLDAVDVMDYYIHDPNVRVIAAVIEGLSDISRFRQMAASAAEREVPIVALKIGRSEKGSRAAIAHTGSLTGADHLYDALFREYGVIRVDDLEDLVETTKFLAADRRPAGTGLAVFASSGGECGLISDMGEQAGLTFPELPAAQRKTIGALLPSYANPGNPLDLTATGWGNRDVYRTAVAELASVPGVDTVACIGQASQHSGPMAGIGWDKMIAGLADGAEQCGKPVVLISTTTDIQPELVDALDAHGIPTLASVQSATRVIGRAGRYSQWLTTRETRSREQTTSSERRAQALALLPPPGSGGVSESIGKRLLELYGIPVPAGDLAQSVEQAVDLAGSVGYPVVLKVEAEGVHHKTEVGGVALNVADEAAVRSEYADLLERLRKHAPDARFEGIRVERMVPGGVEMIVGGHRDPVFGPVVLVGLGGIFTELLRDTSHHLAPVSHTDARAMLDSLRGAALLHGYRGAPPANLDALADLITNVSLLLTELPEVQELDLNPVFASPEGCVAADCLVVM
jgi:acetyltransferase